VVAFVWWAVLDVLLRAPANRFNLESIDFNPFLTSFCVTLVRSR